MQSKLLTISTAILLALSASAGTAATFTENNTALDSTKSDPGKPADSLEKSNVMEPEWGTSDMRAAATGEFDEDRVGALERESWLDQKREQDYEAAQERFEATRSDPGTPADVEQEIDDAG